MTPRRAIVLTAVLLAFLAGTGYVVVRTWVNPARELQRRIAAHERELASFERVLEGRFALRDRKDALGATMLAGPPDEFEHRLRTGLASVAQHAGLTNVASGNGRPSPETSPAAKRSGRTLGSRLRAEPDFAVVRAWVTGVGSLEQVTRALALVQAQPWAHRIEGFSIRPEGAGAEHFKLRVDLASLRMDSVPRTIEDPTALIAPGEEALAHAANVVAAHPFGAPPAPPEPEIRVTQAPAGPPYQRWRVTGLIEGEQIEALLYNAKSGEQRVLTPGQELLGATFTGGSGERARFSFDGQDHEVLVGQTLAERRRTDDTTDSSERVTAREGSP